jgi:hypothetical protein
LVLLQQSDFSRISLTLPHLALDTENGFGAVFGGSDKSKSLLQIQKDHRFPYVLGVFGVETEKV